MSLGRLALVSSSAVAAGLLLRGCVVESIYIATASMEPTLLVGTHFFADKMTLRLRGPSRGDLIVFVSPVPPGEEMVKRVIAIEGDSVELRDKKVFLNGRELDESYVRHVRAEERLRGDNMPQIQVPPGHVFVLGDNRDESNDSSVWNDPATGRPVYFVRRSSIRGLLRGFY